VITQLARALSKVALIKANRPDILHKSNPDLLGATLSQRTPSEADKLAAWLRGSGYDVTYGWDADLGVYAEVSKEGKTVVRGRCSSILECLEQAAKVFGEVS